MIFITEGGPKIGLGHVMRCVAVAEQVRSLRRTPFFIVNKSRSVADIMRARQFHCARVTDIEEAWVSARRTVRDVPVLIDSKKDLSDAVRELQKAGCAVTLIDNATRARLVADAVIYPLEHFNPDTLSWRGARGKVYRGAKYFPLRKEFFTARPGRRGDYLLISMGGADFNNLTGLVLRALERGISNIKVVVVIGKAFPHKAWLKRYARTMRRAIELCEVPEDFPGLLSAARLVITAFGVTVYEAAYYRRRVIVINNYESDMDDSVRLERLGLCRALGFYRDLDPKDIVRGVEDALRSRRTFCVPVRKAAIPDGHGAERIAKLLVSA